VHKDTVFKLGCGMFVEECRRAARDFPDVKVDDVIVDTFAMRLVRDPQSFDVVVTTNMFGDILSDEAAGLVGGLGMAPGLCIGEGAVAMAQATHGSAPDIAGKGLANPYAMIESSRMLIEWLGNDRGIRQAASAAQSMKRAIDLAMSDPSCRTPDILGTASTGEMTMAIVRRIEREP
jgi:3-isopropylmalate dehydrogenase